MARLRDHFTEIHPQAALVITDHAALEREVDQVVKRLMTRPGKLARLSTDHQVSLLRALVDDAWLDLVLDAIGAYGALRNAVAHGDRPEAIQKAIARLGERTAQIGIPLDAGANLGSLAMGLAGALHVGAENHPGSMMVGSDTTGSGSS